MSRIPRQPSNRPVNYPSAAAIKLHNAIGDALLAAKCTSCFYDDWCIPLGDMCGCRCHYAEWGS